MADIDDSPVTPEEEQSDIDILGGEEEEETPEPSETEQDESDEADDEEEEKPEEEEKEIEEEEEEYSGRVAHKDLKKEFPEIFKKFPGLRPIIARENEFAKVFPSPEEAKEALVQNKGFQDLSESILSGNPEVLLSEINKSSPKSLEKFVENFLPTLYKNAPAMFAQTVMPYVNSTLRQCKNDAQKSGDENLYRAVQYISRWLHNDINIPDEKAKDPELEKERNSLENQKREFSQNTARKFSDSTKEETYNSIMTRINRDIDPEGVLGEKARKRAAQDVFEEIDAIVKADERFMAGLKVSFRKAEQAGYSREASDSIRSAYLARVKPLLPAARQKVLADYLPKNPKKPVGTGKKIIPNSGSQGKNGARTGKVDYSKLSDMDILNGKG